MKKNNKTIRKTYPAALTIGESDSISNTGIQADLRTFNAFGVYGCSIITAITSQNPYKIAKIDLVNAKSINQQLDSVLSAIDIKALKIGFLASSDVIKIVAQYIKKYNLPVVYNPEIITTNGELLISNETIKDIKNILFPLVEWIILKVKDAEFLLGKKIQDDNLVDAIQELSKKYRKSILLKTRDHNQSCDIICRKGRIYRMELLNTKIPVFNNNGMESTLSSAMTAGIALGVSWKQMLCESQAFVAGSLKENVLIGNKLNAMYPPARWDSRQVRLISETKEAFNDSLIKNNKTTF